MGTVGERVEHYISSTKAMGNDVKRAVNENEGIEGFQPSGLRDKRIMIIIS